LSKETKRGSRITYKEPVQSILEDWQERQEDTAERNNMTGERQPSAVPEMETAKVSVCDGIPPMDHG
jgi:hypothetical protein